MVVIYNIDNETVRIPEIIERNPVKRINEAKVKKNHPSFEIFKPDKCDGKFPFKKLDLATSGPSIPRLFFITPCLQD